VSTVAEALDAPLVVAAGYLAHPAWAVAGDLADLLGSPALAKQPHDLPVRTFHGIFGLPVATL
jgi:hypothetical protein